MKLLSIIPIILLFSSCIFEPWVSYRFYHAESNTFHLMPSFDSEIPDEDFYSLYYIGDLFVDFSLHYDSGSNLNFVINGYSNTITSEISIVDFEIEAIEGEVLIGIEDIKKPRIFDMKRKTPVHGYNWGGYTCSIPYEYSFVHNSTAKVKIRLSYSYENQEFIQDINYSFIIKRKMGIFKLLISA